MNSQIMLRKIAASAVDLFSLRHTARYNFEPRANGEPVAFSSSQLKTYPMIPRDAMVAKKHGFAVKIFDNDIHLAIIEKVSDGRTP